MQVVLRYWGAARAAAGTAEEKVEVSGETSLAALVADAVRRHDGSRLAEVLSVCSVLIGDRPAGTTDPEQVLVQPGDHVEFLPPFAGG